MVFESHILLFLLLIPLLSLNISCQNSNTNIRSGTILSPSTNSSSLLSPSGDFAFGFRALDTNPTLFFLAVFYYKIEPKTVIWTANGDNPVSNKSKVQLTPEGQLTLEDSPNKQIWSSNIQGASYGSIRDDGNFILFSGSSIVWQTFDSPTDTILPGNVTPKTSSIVSISATCSFTYKELEQATKGFSEELGKGAFGVVYKGVMPSQSNDNNTLTVAVKKLEESLLEEGDQDFENEIATIGQTHHKNLVQLIGFCKEGSHRLIVLEFLSKGSLNKYIFGSNRPDWNQRVQIVLGVANGLAYLHEQCRNQIIHCDIKPQNILLDENMEARISDFGLAKLLRFDQTRTATGIRGTIGYFAPEWFKNVGISAKVDVYSFGVMLLQIICCKKKFEWGLESHERMTVIDWAKNCLENGRLDLLVENDEEAMSDVTALQRFVMVGISCVEDEPGLRPNMKKVVQMLEGTTESSIH